jgi:hypothetical protein
MLLLVALQHTHLQLAGASGPSSAAAAPAAAAAAAGNYALVPPGLHLPPASSPLAMEDCLTDFLPAALHPPLLIPQQYSRLMEQLEQTIRPYKRLGRVLLQLLLLWVGTHQQIE